MSKKKQKKVVTNQLDENLIKQVFTLYKPNKVQKFFMRYFSSLTTDVRVQRTAVISLATTAILSIVFATLGLKESAVATGVTAVVAMFPLVGGIVYNEITNNKRVKEIASVLNLPKSKVIELEKKYYLG